MDAVKQSERPVYRKWYLKNRDKLVARAAEWAKNNPDKRKKCCKKYYTEHADRAKAAQVRYRKEHPRKYLLALAKRRAPAKGQEFSISMSDLPEIPEVCPLLGIVIDPYAEKLSHHPSIDRIDSSKGYVPGNVQIISQRANMLKNNATLDELLCLVCNWMENGGDA